MALMTLAAAAGLRPKVVTIDHGLRDVAAELSLVGRMAARFGMDHTILRWSWDGRGNLQQSARDARRRMIANWAHQAGLGAVALAHTADDQVETVLLRLARGSGVDGLAGMAMHSDVGGLHWLRPLLHERRDTLRSWLRDQGVSWAEDPSNSDPRFDRVRAREMMPLLADLGLTPERVLRVADHMSVARQSLTLSAADWAGTHVTQTGGDLLLPRAVLDLDHEDTPRRVLSAAIAWVGGSGYRPRFDSLRRLVTSLGAGQTAALGGVIATPEAQGARLRLTREARGVADLVVGASDGAIWDGRWRLSGPASAPGDKIRALGEQGLALCPDWRDSALPRRSLWASPAVWRGDQLIAAPLAGFGQWHGQIVTDFRSFLLSR